MEKSRPKTGRHQLLLFRFIEMVIAFRICRRRRRRRLMIVRIRFGRCVAATGGRLATL